MINQGTPYNFQCLSETMETWPTYQATPSLEWLKKLWAAPLTGGRPPQRPPIKMWKLKEKNPKTKSVLFYRKFTTLKYCWTLTPTRTQVKPPPIEIFNMKKTVRGKTAKLGFHDLERNLAQRRTTQKQVFMKGQPNTSHWLSMQSCRVWLQKEECFLSAIWSKPPSKPLVTGHLICKDFPDLPDRV